MGLTFEQGRHRYTLDTPQGVQAKVQGVTTLIGGGIPKPGIAPWYGRMVAEWVDSNPQEVERLRGLPDVRSRGRTRTALVDQLCKVPGEVRDAAADRGTEIHALAEQIIAGDEVEVPDAHAAEVEGYLEFLDTWDVTPVLTEAMVAHRGDWWAGTLDLVATSPHLHDGEPVLIDLKTSNHVYGETALQTAAYARAEFWVDGDDERPMPDIAATYVAHITPQGTDLHPLCTSREEINEAYRQFLVAAFTTKNAGRRDAFLRPPLDPPTTTEKETTA